MIAWLRGLSRSVRSERGALELGELLAGLFTAFCVLFMIIEIDTFGKTYAIYQQVTQDSSALRSAVMKMTEEAASANSVFIPATDALGQDNSDGHEFDILLVTVDASTGGNNANFIAYRRNSSTNMLERYVIPKAPGQTATKTAGFEVPATSMQLTEVDASAAPATLPEAAVFSSVKPQDIKKINMGYPGVVAGNSILHVVIANSATSETVDLVQGLYDVKTYFIVGTFTPTPGPCPSGYSGTMPNCTALDFNTWPVQLILGASETAVGTTCGCTPYNVSYDPLDALVKVANALAGGGVAQAAPAAAQSCYALAQDGGGNPDKTLPASVSVRSGVYVDANGCEVDADDEPIPAKPPDAGGVSAGMLAYNASGASETYSIAGEESSGACSGSGIANLRPWYPSSASGVQVDLETQGVSPGSCSVTLSNGVSTQTAKAGAGLVGVTVNAGPCSTLPDGSIYVPVGSTCSSATAIVPDAAQCDVTEGAGGIDQPGNDGKVEFAVSDPALATVSPAEWVDATISGPPFTFTRLASGPVTVTEYAQYEYFVLTGEGTPNEACGPRDGPSTKIATWTFE